MLFLFEAGSRLPPGSWWMEFQHVINGVLLYAQGLSGFTKDCEPLEGEAQLVSRPWNPCPYCQQSPPPHPLPGRGMGGGCEVEDFPDSNCKAPHFDFPWWEERPGLCFLWLQPRLRENIGSRRAHQSHLPHTLTLSDFTHSPVVHTAPLHHLPDEHLSSGIQKATRGSRVQKLGFQATLEPHHLAPANPCL